MVAKKTHNCPMSAVEMREILKQIKYSQVGMADLLNVNDTTIRRAVGKNAVNHDGAMILLLRMMSLLENDPEILQVYSIKEVANICANHPWDEVLQVVRSKGTGK